MNQKHLLFGFPYKKNEGVKNPKWFPFWKKEFFSRWWSQTFVCSHLTSTKNRLEMEIAFYDSLFFFLKGDREFKCFRRNVERMKKYISRNIEEYIFEREKLFFEQGNWIKSMWEEVGAYTMTNPDVELLSNK